MAELLTASRVYEAPLPPDGGLPCDLPDGLPERPEEPVQVARLRPEATDRHPERVAAAHRCVVVTLNARHFHDVVEIIDLGPDGKRFD